MPLIKTEQDLNQFTGTEHYYKHPLFGFNYTDGVKYMAEKAGAYWLLDAIGSYQMGKIRAVPFQIWRLEKADNALFPIKNGAILTMKEDCDMPVLIKQEIEYTDFPLESIELWLIDGVLLLKSEY